MRTSFDTLFTLIHPVVLIKSVYLSDLFVVAKAWSCRHLCFPKGVSRTLRHSSILYLWLSFKREIYINISEQININLLLRGFILCNKNYYGNKCQLLIGFIRNLNCLRGHMAFKKNVGTEMRSLLILNFGIIYSTF